MTPDPTTHDAPRTAMAGRVLAMTRALTRLQATRARLLLAGGVILALGVAAVGVGTVGGGDDLFDLLREPLLGMSVPLIALVFAVASLGDLAEDQTLVYLWLRPVPRIALALAAWLAAVAVALPLNLLTVTVVTVAGGEAAALGAAALAVTLVTLAYTSVFVALGLRTTRSLLWGLGYVVLLEGFLARLSDQLAAMSLRHHAETVLDTSLGTAPPELSPWTAALVLAGAVGLGLGATTWWLRSRDVA